LSAFDAVPTDTPAATATSLIVALRPLSRWSAASGRPAGTSVPSPLVPASPTPPPPLAAGPSAAGR
jgi:hypothetical protein